MNKLKKIYKLFDSKKILVTGGAGFIGSNLIKSLASNSRSKIYSIDNYFTGSKVNHIEGVKYIHDEAKNINKYFRKIKFDYIFHLGEYSRVEESFNDIDKVIEFNLNSFYQILKFTKKNKAKLIYSGSSTKFGEYIDADNGSPYSWVKYSNTEFLKKFAAWYDIKYAITYFYNVYGIGEISHGKYSTVIGKFLRLKKNNFKSLPITSPGTQKRNFTHIQDIINGLLIVAIKGKGDGYGIGSNKSYSIIQIANMLNMKYHLTKSKKGNRLSSILKVTKTKKLGWNPKINLTDYLKNY